jgi:hypothetical protein
MKTSSQVLPKAAAATECGGGQARGNARHQRAFRRFEWMHICLRSEKATGRLGFLNPRNFLKIQKILRDARKQYSIDIADFANGGQQLHLRLRTGRREDFQNFLRQVTCLIARDITGARKGQPFGRFWDGLCYSRVLKGRHLVAALESMLRVLKRMASLGEAHQREMLWTFHEWRFVTPTEFRTQAPPFSTA